MNLGEQIGPMPLGAWVAVVGGGLGIAVYSKRRSIGKATATPMVDTSTDPGVGVGAGFVNSTFTNTPAADTTTATTNEQWAVNAINYLIAYVPGAAGAADLAVRKYLAGQHLSVQEFALIQMALIKLGSPPQPLPPPVDYGPADPPAVVPPAVVPPPPPSPAPAVTPPSPPPPVPIQPAPISIRLVIVLPWPAQTSTLWGIARKYYGDGNQWRRIYDANRRGVVRPDGTVGFIVNPDLIHPGERMFVP